MFEAFEQDMHSAAIYVFNSLEAILLSSSCIHLKLRPNIANTAARVKSAGTSGWRWRVNRMYPRLFHGSGF